MASQQMNETTEQARDLASLAGQDRVLLTTYSYRDGMAQEVPMRFALQGNTIYVLSEEGGEATWVQNLLRNPEASLSIGTQKRAGMGRVLTGDEEAERARRLLAEKYEGWHAGEELSDWARTGLPVAIDLSARPG
jgi:deazaflavin-dependent oxidoreductase (nitroreductase family)